MSKTVIKTCTCPHEFQDETYGHMRRVHNWCAKGWRCTVCGNVISDPEHLNIPDADNPIFVIQQRKEYNTKQKE